MPDIERCQVCDWPTSERWQDGCVPGNCARRPAPKKQELHGEWLKKQAKRDGRCDAPMEIPLAPPLPYDEACHLSRMFNSVCNLRLDQDRRINEWLKEQITEAFCREATVKSIPSGVTDGR